MRQPHPRHAGNTEILAGDSTGGNVSLMPDTTTVTTHALTLVIEPMPRRRKWAGSALCSCEKWEHQTTEKPNPCTVSSVLAAHFYSHVIAERA